MSGSRRDRTHRFMPKNRADRALVIVQISPLWSSGMMMEWRMIRDARHFIWFPKLESSIRTTTFTAILCSIQTEQCVIHWPQTQWQHLHCDNFSACFWEGDEGKYDRRSFSYDRRGESSALNLAKQRLLYRLSLPSFRSHKSDINRIVSRFRPFNTIGQPRGAQTTTEDAISTKPRDRERSQYTMRHSLTSTQCSISAVASLSIWKDGNLLSASIYPNVV